MNDIVKPGSGLLFMKIGTHAQEELSDIIARKTEEIRQTGYGMWGYGGNTCHPSSMVQPFARKFAEAGRPIHLCMEEMDSNHVAEPLSSAEFSIDGLTWERIPDTISVRGSRYALVIENLHQERLTIPLNQTRVAVGPSLGKLGSRYVLGRVDKACLEVSQTPELANDAVAREVEISLVAELRQPYAVFLRGQR